MVVSLLVGLVSAGADDLSFRDYLLWRSANHWAGTGRVAAATAASFSPLLVRVRDEPLTVGVSQQLPMGPDQSRDSQPLPSIISGSADRPRQLSGQSNGLENSSQAGLVTARSSTIAAGESSLLLGIRRYGPVVCIVVVLPWCGLGLLSVLWLVGVVVAGYGHPCAPDATAYNGLHRGASTGQDVYETKIGAAATNGSDISVGLGPIPRHVAVIMDGNRRYGREHHGNAIAGHRKGGETLVKFLKWCLEANVEELTAYAFSTENWNRPQAEIDALMDIFVVYCDRIRVEAVQSNVRVRVLSSDPERLPATVRVSISSLEAATAVCDGFLLNLCVSYGSRDEILRACRKLADSVLAGNLLPTDISADMFSSALLTGGQRDPDLLVRTSGEVRLSNFLLWQVAYTEMVFVDKHWPDVSKSDFEALLKEFRRRKRRFGK